eukprot:3383994-Lingulodinium_polyedra.AAC.1
MTHYAELYSVKGKRLDFLTKDGIAIDDVTWQNDLGYFKFVSLKVENLFDGIECVFSKQTVLLPT